MLRHLSLSAFVQSKVVEPPSLAKWRQQLKQDARRPTVATLNGSFDLLHAGHLYILYEAAKQADILLVALNSDASIKKYKNPNRPFVPLQYRIELMAAIEFVSFVTWFDETDPCRLLELVQPDVHVNGIEYGSDCIEAEITKKIGARLHLVDRIGGLSTSSIVKKIQQVCD
jgi:rfaE bifunctional protein nucleotidyltransferase chain/domain